MRAGVWLQNSVQRLLGNSNSQSVKASAEKESRPVTTQAPRVLPPPPRALRKPLLHLQSIVDTKVSEVEGGRRAESFSIWYTGLDQANKEEIWMLMSEYFGPDVTEVSGARQAYEDALGSAEEGTAEIRLRRSLISPRTRLLQRFAAYSGGMRFLVDLRAQILPHLKTNKRLVALDAELEQLFSTWFDVAFLELRRLSWDSPASLVEKLIQYEAVHDIRSWGDLKNRLDSDRRCYGFFHPSLPNEPLIFVEVALLNEIADSITPLLDEAAAPQDIKKSTVAIFYSISNTQTGLKGVSFGDSLIKRVVQVLKDEFVKLRVFATLSPIPGFRAWATKNIEELWSHLDTKELMAMARAMNREGYKDSKDPKDLPSAQDFLAVSEQALSWDEKSPLRSFMTRCAATYLGATKVGSSPADAVARFHLSNGARIDRLNWAADPSTKGMRQSWGLMVNYLYDLKKLDRHRRDLNSGAIPASPDVESLIIKLN